MNMTEVDKWLLKASEGKEGLKEVLRRVWDSTNISLSENTFLEIVQEVIDDWRNNR